MCIIFIKNKSASWPTDEEIDTCWSINHDGAGFAWWRPGDDKVSYVRGLMDKPTMLGAFKKLKDMLPKESVVIGHFRIGTSGKISPSMTHPFPVSGKDTFGNLAGKASHVFAHNGIFSKMPHHKKMSDTAQYVHYVLGQLPLDDIGLVQYLMDETVSGGRTVLLYSDGSYLKSGYWQDDKGSGLIWSNGGYKGYGGLYSGYTARQYGGWNADEWGWDDDDYISAKGIVHDNRPAVIPSSTSSTVQPVTPALTVRQSESVPTFHSPALHRSVKSYIWLPRGTTVYDEMGKAYYQGMGRKGHQVTLYLRGDSVLFASGLGEGWEEIGEVTMIDGSPVFV